MKAGLGVLKVFMAGDKIWAGNKSMVLFYREHLSEVSLALMSK